MSKQTKRAKPVDAWACVSVVTGQLLGVRMHRDDVAGFHTRLVPATSEAEVRALRRVLKRAVEWRHLHNPFAEYEHEKQLRRAVDAALKPRNKKPKVTR